MKPYAEQYKDKEPVGLRDLVWDDLGFAKYEDTMSDEPNQIITDREIVLSQATLRALTGIAEMRAYVLANYHETIPVSRVLKELEKIEKAMTESSDG